MTGPTTAPPRRAAGSGLDPLAYDVLPEGVAYPPFVPPEESPAEFTLKAVVAGILFGILFGSANAYLGLRVGLTISTSIPVAVLSIALFRALGLFGVRSTLLETNIAQTVGSASSSLASGVIFTVPALFMWGFSPGLLQLTFLALCGGLLGVVFMIPLRRFLIAGEHGRLPYPEGTACAEVLVASESGGNRARNIFLGLGTGMLFKLAFGLLKVLPGDFVLKLPFVRKGEVASEASSALAGVGFILGPRIAAVMVGGGLLSWVVIIPVIALIGEGLDSPVFPETVRLITDMSAREIWTRYVRYIGAGAVAMAGLMTLARSLPTMIRSFRIGARQIAGRLGGPDRLAGASAARGGPGHVPGARAAAVRTDRDLPAGLVAAGALLVAVVLASVPFIFGIEAFGFRAAAAVCVVVFAFFFVTVSSRIVGLVGVTSNPTSGMTIATLLGTAGVFLLLGWTDDLGKAAALTVGCVVAIAVSIAGDTSQDLKTGFLLGATPSRQQTGEIIGVMTCAVFIVGTFLLIGNAWGFGNTEIPAPQATLMKVVIEGVLDQSLPWALVGIGAGLAVIIELLGIPSLPFAVGVYLPVATMVPVYLGGLVRMAVDKTSRTDAEREARREKGILFGSGLVGGEGLFMVVIAATAAYTGRAPTGLGFEWIGHAGGELASAGVMALLLVAFWRLAR